MIAVQKTLRTTAAVTTAGPTSIDSRPPTGTASAVSPLAATSWAAESEMVGVPLRTSVRPMYVKATA
ncbi:hypothetical protein SPURM210S_08194 [Streptomyces purpurascens]